MADNRWAIVEVIRDNGPVAQRDIQRLTRLGGTTVGAVVTELRTRGAILDVEGVKGRGAGRPPTLHVLNPDLARVVGIQFEHTHVRATIADLHLNRLDSRIEYLPVSSDPRAAMAAGAEMIEALIGASGVPRHRVIGAAMALAAPVDMSTGTVRKGRALGGWVGLQPGPALERLVKVPVVAANDATLAGLGEAVVGAARGSQHTVYLKLSASIGCGIVMGGRPYGGATGTAGELAHVVVDEAGDLCFCGNRGCLWLLVGAEKILDDLRPSHGSDLDDAAGLSLDERLKRVITWARSGDSACQRKLREVAATVGLALVNICNLLDPETIVVGGILSGTKKEPNDLLLEPLREWVHRRTRDISSRPVRIVTPGLEEYAEVVGAAALVLRGATPAFVRRLEAVIVRPESRRR